MSAVASQYQYRRKNMLRVSSGSVRRNALMSRPVSAASKLSSTLPGAATHSASSSSGAQVCPLPRFCAAARSKRSSARFRVMRPRYGASRAGRLVGMLFQAASQVSFSHSSASWALCRMLSAILRQYAPNFAAVSASACSSRAQYRATIAASSMVSASFII